MQPASAHCVLLSGECKGRCRPYFCFIGGANPQERSDQSLNLASDIIKALTANRQLGLGSLVDDIKCDYSSVDGDKFGFNGIGIGYIRATIKFQSDTGV